MIAKQLISGYDTSTAFPASVLLPAFSKGFDKDTLHKEASMFEDMYDAFERKPGHTYIHLISVAAGEQYGPNSRADFYNGHPYEVVFPYPEKGGRKAIMLDGGIEKYHSTFDKEGGVYTEHRSGRDGYKPQGYIVVSGFNKDMQRGELIIGVKTDAWRDDIEKLSNGTPLRFSIGADARHDFCLPAGTLIMTDTGMTPIEYIRSGDTVYTVDGNWRPVLNTMNRVSDEMTTIKVYGYPLPTEITPNHPVYVVPAERIKSCHGSSNGVKPRHRPDDRGICKRCGKPIDFTAVWVNAENVKVGDYIKVAIDGSNDEDTAGVDFAYMCGMYVGNGNIIFSRYGHEQTGAPYASGVQFTLSGREEDRDIYDRLLEAGTAVYGKTPDIDKDYSGRNAYVMIWRDKLYTHKIFELFGNGCKVKSIPQAVLNWSKEEKAAFIAGYIDSDGYAAHTKGSISIVSVNRGLAFGAQRILWSLGVPVTVGLHSRAKWIKSFESFSSEAYHVYMSNCPELIAKYSAKCRRGCFTTREKFDGPTVLLHDGFAYLRVTEVKTRECTPTRVFNFEVADDNSYIAEGLPVHNCSICGHKATTEPGHCDHYKNERGVIYDDGNQQYVISDNLVFHDISRVRNPAEKIAFSIRKVASNGLGFEYTDETLKPHLSSVPYMLKTAKARKKFDTLKKLSKIEKKIIAESKGGVLDPGLVSMFHTKNAKSSADSLCKFLRYTQDENELIGALNEKGVLLSPEEFATVFVPEDTKPLIHMDDYKAAIPGIFNDLLGRDDVEVICSDETYDPKPCKNGLIIQAVIDYKNDGGFSPEDAIDEALGRFLSGVELHSESPRIIVCKKRCKGVSDALAEEYANYMLSSADNLSPDALTAALLRAII